MVYDFLCGEHQSVRDGHLKLLDAGVHGQKEDG